MLDLLTNIWNWLKDQGPALGLLILDFENAKKQKAEQALAQAQLDLKLEKNHEQVDSENIGVSDVDGVNKIAGPDS